MSDAPTVWRVVVASEDSDTLFMGDVIEHLGEKWLVPWWLHSKTEATSQPERIVRLSGFRLQWHPGGKMGDGTVGLPIPKRLLDYEAPLTAEDDALAIDRPEITRIVPRRMN